MKKRIFVTLLAVLMLLATVFATVSCGNDEPKTPDGYSKYLYLYNWSEYMSQEVLDLFEEEYGIKVVMSTFESNDEMFAKLLAGNNGTYDIAVPSNFFIESMLASNLLEELDEGVMTNLNNIDEAYRNMDYDPEGKYTIPYMGTVCVWVANKTKLAELGVEINDYNDLLDPALKSNVLMTDDSQGNISIALTACGLDPTNVSLEDIAVAKQYLLDLNSNVKAYSLPADVRDAMIRNEAAVAYMYGGNAVQAMLENDDLIVIMEDQPNSLSVDTMVILKGSKHKTEAELFLNFILRPEISAKLTDMFPYVSFNKYSSEYVDKQLSSNPLVYLSDVMKENLYLILTFDGDIISAEVDAMTEVKLAR